MDQKRERIGAFVVTTKRNLSEAGKHQWRDIIVRRHHTLFEKIANRWMTEAKITPLAPLGEVDSCYNSGEEGAIDYSHLGSWEQECFWFLYDEYDIRVKIWVFSGPLGAIVDCIEEMEWRDGAISDLKRNRWLVVYRDNVIYCKK